MIRLGSVGNLFEIKICQFSLTTLNPAIQASITCFIYAIFVICAFLFQKYATDVDIPFMIGTYVFVFLNIIGCAISWFFMPKPHHFDEVEDELIPEDSPSTEKTFSQTSIPKNKVSTSEVSNSSSL